MARISRSEAILSVSKTIYQFIVDIYSITGSRRGHLSGTARRQASPAILLQSIDWYSTHSEWMLLSRNAEILIRVTPVALTSERKPVGTLYLMSRSQQNAQRKPAQLTQRYREIPSRSRGSFLHGDSLTVLRPVVTSKAQLPVNHIS